MEPKGTTILETGGTTQKRIWRTGNRRSYTSMVIVKKRVPQGGVTLIP